jgi:hypothetical protein
VDIVTKFVVGDSAKVKQEADSMNKTLDNMNQNTKIVQKSFKESSREILQALSTIQLMRFAAKDIVDLASGEGGFPDILSLATSSILIVDRLNSMLQTELLLNTVLTAQSLIATGTMALGPVGITVGTIALAAGVSSAFNDWNTSNLDKNLMQEQRMRMQAYRSVIGN